MRSMIRFSIIAIFCFALGCTSKKQDRKSKKVEELTKLAAISDSLKDLSQSISYYTQILEIDSTNLLATVNRGRALAFNGQIEEGFADYDRAIRLYPDERNYYVRAMVYVHLKQYDKAFADLQACLNINPKFGEAYWGLSFVKESKNELDSAIFYCDKAEANNCPVDQASLAEQYTDAIKDFDKAIKLDSVSAFAYNNKAFAILKTGEAEKALELVTVSLQSDDKNPYAYKTRAEVYLALRKIEKACKDLATAEELDVDKKLQKDIKTLKEKICK